MERENVFMRRHQKREDGFKALEKCGCDLYVMARIGKWWVPIAIVLCRTDFCALGIFMLVAMTLFFFGSCGTDVFRAFDGKIKWTECRAVIARSFREVRDERLRQE